MPILRPNTIFAERYLLVEHLGSGGFSEVWKVEDQMANNAVLVVKIFSPQTRLDKANIDLFKSEFSLILPLKHPHLLKANQFDTFEGRPYLLLDYCRGGNLFTKLKAQGRAFTEWEIAEVMHQIGGSLGYLHDKGIAHQDIKPDNILIGDPGSYYLTDFGISIKVRRTLRATLEEVKSNARSTSAYTPEYASPEIFRFARPSYLSDIFSFGVMLYEMAAGKPPCERTGEALLNIQDLEIMDLPSPYSKGLSFLLKTCMSRKPEHRPTAHELEKYAQAYLQTGKWPLSVNAEAKEVRETIPPVRLQEQRQGSETDLATDLGDQPKQTQKIVSENTKKTPQDALGEISYRHSRRRTPPSVDIPIRPRKPPAVIGYTEPKANRGEFLKFGAIALSIAVLAALLFQFRGEIAGLFTAKKEVPVANQIRLPFIFDGGLNEAGLPEGHGVAEYGNGAVYNGNWRNGKKHGLGDLKFPNGDSYFGEFENDEMHGENGTYTFNDEGGNLQYKYIGNFKNGKMEGTGKLYGETGQLLFRGRWEAGKYVGRAN